MGKVISIGKQDFASLRENDYFFVDKTKFIKEWWENGDDITLITRPRRLKNIKYEYAGVLFFYEIQSTGKFI